MFLFLLPTTIFSQNTKEIIGYYPNWQWYDRGNLVNPLSIDYSKYTVINYAFFSPQLDGTIISTDTWADENLLLGQPDWANGGYLPNTNIVDLAHNNGVKILPSIGGWTLSSNFPSIAADPTIRANFVQACVGLIDTYGFDGVDLDWEYPGYAPHNGGPADMNNFTLLLQDIRAAFDSLTLVTGDTYLITSAMGAAPSHISNIDWAAVTPLLDMINLMSYDFYGTWDGYNNHNSPLYAPTTGDPALCIDAAFTTLTTTYGVPSDKINIGVAFYGRSATGSTALFAPNSGMADEVTFSADEGIPLYYNIMSNIGLFTQNWDATAQVPYLSGNSISTFVSYDNEQSIGLKAEYIVNNNAGGAIIWEITGDYMETSEGSGVIAGTPLADTLYAVLLGGSSGLPQNPIVNITNPNNGDLLIQGTTIDLTATATDADGTITSVEFMVDGQTLAATNTVGSTYLSNWTPLNTGTFTLTASATDNDGQTTTTNINITILSSSAQAPTVSITDPTDGSTLTSTPVVLQADATDSDGTIASVIFTIGGNNLAATNTSGSTYEVTWSPPGNGTYTIVATVTDNDGLAADQTISTSINVPPPVGDILGDFVVTSDWGTGYCADITLTNNSLNEINGWTLDFALSNPVTSAWNVSAWNNYGDGTYDFTDDGWNGILTAGGGTAVVGVCATYTDSISIPQNAFLNALPVVFGGSTGNPNPPVVAITVPTDGSSLPLAPVTLTAEATDTDGTIVSVEFIVDGQTIVATHSGGNTYTATWTPTTENTFLIEVTATDSDGLTATDNISVMISNAPLPPSISITAPTSGATLPLATVTLTATATDTDGTIANVEFMVDGQTIVATNSGGNTYTATWTPTTENTFAITATVTDNDGLTATDNSSVTISNNAPGNTLTLNNLPLQINVNAGDSVIHIFDAAITAVLSRNLDVVEITVNGTAVTFKGLSPGRTGLKITAGGQDYFMGFRVNNDDGTMPGMPKYLSMGSVSEDTNGDLNFWKDVNVGQTNKSMDIRYIYINGGPFTGWSSWGPNRPTTFAEESLRHGLIPFFVYYNIPDGGESFFTDLAHANDPAYMTAYFADLDNFMTQVENVLQGELYGIILEPDFLGYMQQNAVPNDPGLITTCVSADAIADSVGTIITLVERINKTIDDKRALGHNLIYGWQLNLWSYPIEGAPQGVLRITDQLGYNAGRQVIQNAATQTTLYAIASGALSNNANFLSIDKYGLDAMGHINSSDPAASTWFFNNDHWNNYLHYVNTMNDISGYPVILWQLPVGHINSTTETSAYTGAAFPDLNNTSTHFEDSCSDFFLGDTFTANDTLRQNYFSQNLYNDPKLQVNGNEITFGNHLQETKDAGVISVLFGAGVGASTDGIGDPATDDYFWIQKVQDYYLNGTIPLDCPIFPTCDSGCPPVLTIAAPENGGQLIASTLDTIDITILAWDTNGLLTNLEITVDGQTFTPTISGFTYIIPWTPSNFGQFTITATATDDEGLTTTQTTVYNITEFDPALCPVPIWNSNTVYNVAGTQVVYNGDIYENQWWTQGDIPGAGGTTPWQFIEQCIVCNAVGGIVSTPNATTICAGDATPDIVNISTTGSGDSYAYIVTDTSNNIIQAPTTNTTLDLDNLSVTDARIYGLGYNGSLLNTQIGQPISGVLSTGGCAVLSDNFVTITNNCTVSTTVTVQINVLLEGVYNSGTGLMESDLVANNLLPLTQPYHAEPWWYAGTETFANAADIPTNAIDWVLVEMRESGNNLVIADSRAAILLDDGTVADLNGSTGVDFNNLTAGQSYYIVLRHRNHLAVISSNPVTVPNATSYDFTNFNNVQGGFSQLTELNNTYTLIAGDINADGVISVADFNVYVAQTSAINQYLQSDVNLNSTVTVGDFNLYLPNSSVIGVQEIRY